MTSKDVLSFSRLCDVECVMDLLNLGEEGRLFFRLRYIEHRSIQQIADTMGKAYSTTSHISMEVNRKLSELDL